VREKDRSTNCSLSLRERVRVRGKSPIKNPPLTGGKNGN
jgi:hypothetical protein